MPQRVPMHVTPTSDVYALACVDKSMWPIVKPVFCIAFLLMQPSFGVPVVAVGAWQVEQQLVDRIL